MKFASTKREQGSVLVIAMVTCLSIATVLASFLLLTSTRYNLTVRSMGWNSAIPVLEAGVEEAMTHLHQDLLPTANGWTAGSIGGQPVHTKRRNFADGSYFNVTVYNATSTIPVIYSSGFIPSPLRRSNYISRIVRVDTTNPPSMFVRAITTMQKITLGSNMKVDGFNSDLGGYDVVTNRHATAGIATASMAAGAVSVGGANVYGPVTTGPGGTVTVGGGAVGDVAWNASHSGIEPGWDNNNFNAAFPTNAPPGGGPFLAPVVTSAGGSNVYLLPTGTNQMASYSGGTPIIVTGHATLWVTGNIRLSGGDVIKINPGASLKLYAGGDVKLGGNGVINGTALAASFSLIGLPGNTSITVSGTADFMGTIYAPQADLKINGTPVIYGAVMAKSLDSNGTPKMHYDEAVAKGTGLVATGWKEL